MAASAGKEPFIDMVTRGLRFGAFAGLCVYFYGAMTNNPSLYSDMSVSIMDHDIKLNNLKFTQLQQVYQEELRRYAGDGGGEKDKDKDMFACGVGEEIPLGAHIVKGPFHFRNGEPCIVYQRDTLVEALANECNELAATLSLKDEGEEEREWKRMIEMLHEYNEVKDIAQALIGKLAVIEGCTTKDLYPKYDLDLAD